MSQKKRIIILHALVTQFGNNVVEIDKVREYATMLNKLVNNYKTQENEVRGSDVAE